jgi:hypothetical protein
LSLARYVFDTCTPIIYSHKTALLIRVGEVGGSILGPEVSYAHVFAVLLCLSKQMPVNCLKLDHSHLLHMLPNHSIITILFHNLHLKQTESASMTNYCITQCNRALFEKLSLSWYSLSRTPTSIMFFTKDRHWPLS